MTTRRCIDRQDAVEYLTSFDYLSWAANENYLAVALDRMLVTLRMLADAERLWAPATRPRRVLEIGAHPYFMTLLLKRYFPDYELSLLNEPERLQQDGGRFTVRSQRYGLEYTFTYDTANVDLEPLPYPDRTFDAVIYCETIEHMTYDPMRSVYECHRVLKPGGHLILSTPNVLRAENFWKMLRGRGFNPPFSGYGPYARHNREFAPNEVVLMLASVGLVIEELRIVRDPAYEHPKEWDWLLRLCARRGWLARFMDVIHVRAHATGRPAMRFPPELYVDVHAYERIENDNITMGVNDEAQVRPGFYYLERWPPCVRWTGADAVAALKRKPHQRWLHIRFFSGPRELGRQVSGRMRVAGVEHPFSVDPGEWVVLSFPLPDDAPEKVRLQILMDQTFCPAELNGSADRRRLGIAVERIWLE